MSANFSPDTRTQVKSIPASLLLPSPRGDLLDDHHAPFPPLAPPRGGPVGVAQQQTNYSNPADGEDGESLTPSPLSPPAMMMMSGSHKMVTTSSFNEDNLDEMPVQDLHWQEPATTTETPLGSPTLEVGHQPASCGPWPADPTPTSFFSSYSSAAHPHVQLPQLQRAAAAAAATPATHHHPHHQHQQQDFQQQSSTPREATGLETTATATPSPPPAVAAVSVASSAQLDHTTAHRAPVPAGAVATPTNKKGHTPSSDKKTAASAATADDHYYVVHEDDSVLLQKYAVCLSSPEHQRRCRSMPSASGHRRTSSRASSCGASRSTLATIAGANSNSSQTPQDSKAVLDRTLPGQALPAAENSSSSVLGVKKQPEAAAPADDATAQLRADLALALSRIAALEQHETVHATTTAPVVQSGGPREEPIVLPAAKAEQKATSRSSAVPQNASLPKCPRQQPQPVGRRTMTPLTNPKPTPAPTSTTTVRPPSSQRGRARTPVAHNPSFRTMQHPAAAAAAPSSCTATATSKYSGPTGPTASSALKARPATPLRAVAALGAADTRSGRWNNNFSRAGTPSGRRSNGGTDEKMNRRNHYSDGPHPGVEVVPAHLELEQHQLPPKGPGKVFVQDCEVTRDGATGQEYRRYHSTRPSTPRGGEGEEKCNNNNKVAAWEATLPHGSEESDGLTSGAATPRSAPLVGPHHTETRVFSRAISMTSGNSAASAASQQVVQAARKVKSNSRIVTAIEAFLKKVDPLRVCHARAIAQAMKYDEDNLRRRLATDYGWKESVIASRYLL